MSIRKLLRALQIIFRQFWRLSGNSIERLSNWLLRGLLRTNRQQRRAPAGFVLPTVAMVMLVTILLTTAMVLRSLDRSKNASNFRVSQSVLNTSGAAIERAKAKIEELLNDPTLPRSTPSESTLYNTIAGQPEKYTFGDEIALKVVSDFGNGDGGSPGGDSAIQSLDNGTTPGSGGGATSLANSETLNTAWKFPVDTDNNGKYDSFTLYGIYFRSPPFSGELPDRERSPLDARTPPMEEVAVTGQCADAAGTSASLVGSSGWYRVNGELRKSFYAYAATVPITEDPSTIPLVNPATGAIDSPPSPAVAGLYEEYPGGNRGFSALEFQQDQGQIPLQYQAVWFEDDLSITPGPGLNLNGRVFTNSNLFVATRAGNLVNLYLISSPASCYFEEENSKVVAGGNVVNGGVTWSSSEASSGDDAKFHMFNEGLPVGGSGLIIRDLSTTTQSINNSSDNPYDVAYNSAAYQDRLDFLARSAITLLGGGYSVAADGTVTVTANDPQDVKNRVKARLEDDDSLDPVEVREEEMLLYFRNRTRRVPYKEVPFGVNALAVAGAGGGTYTSDVDSDGVIDAAPAVFTTGSHYTITGYIDPSGDPDTLRPPDSWVFPTNALGVTGTGYTNLTLNIAGTIALPGMTEPDQQEAQDFESFLGDRILLGNNLPALWFKNGRFVGRLEPQALDSINWTDPPGEGPRTRFTRTQRLDDLGATNRNGFWERSSLERPDQRLENKGGLRIVTGAGIYVAGNDPLFPRSTLSFLPQPVLDTNITKPPLTYGSLPNIVAWPDTMPMWADTNQNDLSDTPPTIGGTDLMGDLLMRATAVYHYASIPEPTEPRDRLPIACVSSYYDPTTLDTAKNYVPAVGTGTTNLWDITPLPDDISPVPGPRYDPVRGRSNNGIVYRFPATISENRALSITTYLSRLRLQARLIFPNGRIANEPLRTALEHYDADTAGGQLTMADNAAIDTAICSLGILDSSLAPLPSPPIPHGAIYEQAFLDAQQIKAIHRDEPTDALDQTFSFNNGELGTYNPDSYNLAIEERQPLEIRATAIDLSLLRDAGIAPVADAPNPEFLLPNSGIIYATRDDALPDRSAPGTGDTQLRASAVDFKLDPTRRPNAIMLIEGDRLDRDRTPTNNGSFYDEEKGLILATDLPVYVKGDFNRHESADTSADLEEFNASLADDWGNFYDRSTLSTDFACRRNQTGCSETAGGDLWRSATIVSDAVTALSDTFRFGFRVEGDYDLRNNAGGVHSDSTTTSNRIIDSSSPPDGIADIDPANTRRDNGFLGNNYVTSRAFAELPYRDLVTGPPALAAVGTPPFNVYPTDSLSYQPSSYFNNFVTPVQRRTGFYEFVMEICRQPMVSLCTSDDWVVGYDVNNDGDLDDIAQEDSAAGGTSDLDLLVNLDLDGDGTIAGATLAEKEIKASLLPRNNPFYVVNRLGAGTTARPARVNLATPNAAENLTEQRYPRRVAFLRDINTSTPNNRLLLTVTGAGAAVRPIPIGINTAEELDWYPYQNPGGGANRVELPITAENQLKIGSGTPTPLTGFGAAFPAVNAPRRQPNTLWYVTRQGANRAYSNARWLSYQGYTDPTTLVDIGTTIVSSDPGGVWTVETSDTDKQPILEPVTQLSVTTRFMSTGADEDIGTLSDASKGENPSGGDCDGNSCFVLWTRWLQRANDPSVAPFPTSNETNINMVAVAGQGPVRIQPATARNEDGGGLHNFIRTLESWGGSTSSGGLSNAVLRINGSFIQTKANNFATAPFFPLLNDDDIDIEGEYLFIDRQGYKTATGGLPLAGFGGGSSSLGALPYYTAPQRQFGFDVGLLTQPADLFAEQFTVEKAESPKEFLREVSRDDNWVEALMCGAQASDRIGGPGATYSNYAISDPNQRPDCPFPLSAYPANP